MSETSAIDEKKTESDSNSNNGFKIENIGKFLLSLLVVILLILSYFGSASFILYMCKIAQSNILPTKSNCMPYQSKDPTITPIKTNIFVTLTDPPLSEKLSFDYFKNRESMILDMLREYKEDPETNFIINYFISIVENITIFNYSSYNIFFNLLNQIPEILLVLIGPFVSFFYVSLIFLLSYLVMLGSWFYEMRWFFKTSTTENNKPKWENNFSIMNIIIGYCLIWIFMAFLVVGMMFGVIPLIPFIIMIMCVFSILGYKSELNGKEATVFTVMKELFKNYKVTISTIITFFVIILSFMSLGSIPGIISIVTVLLIYFGTISIEIFQPMKLDMKLTALVSNKQAENKCKADIKSSVGTGILNRIFRGGGKNLMNEIKKLSKQMN